MARFAQYAMVASEEALSDAGWYPKKEDDLEATVWDRGWYSEPC
jgi:3-oxoacyl-[acyl-carrier-protein] synthase II